jgi:hypothetical protein
MDIDFNTVLAAFPKLELSYETLVHKKVHNADIFSAVPDSNPYYIWFTSYYDKTVCLLLELDTNDKTSYLPVNVKVIQTGFKDHLAYGTILYGHVFKHKTGNSCFAIDNIYWYKGKDISGYKYNQKLDIMKELLTKDISQYALTKKYWIFGLPVIDTDINNILRNAEMLPYKVKYIKCRSIDSNKTMVFTYYKPGANLGQNQVKIEPTVFKLKAGLDQDIYNLYVYNGKTNDYDYHDVAFIPDYKTSVFMNGIFRNIKENRCLDALEESDDEQEFEDERDDKYVDLEKSVKMLCEYSHKFKKWVPKKCVHNREKVTTIGYLRSLIIDEKKKSSPNIYVQKYRK